MRRNIIIFIIVLVLTLFFSSFVNADPCGGTRRCRCGDTLVESQTMWYDLLNCPSGGLTIGNNHITLDCNNHIIDGDNPVFDTKGIYVFYSDSTVTNCNVYEFYEGIFIEKASYNNVISFNNASYNQITGIRINDLSGSNILYNNILGYNNGIGIYLATEADNNTVSSNIIINNGEGVHIVGQNNNLWNNTLINNNINAWDNGGFNNWNLSDVGNYWDDFPSNPGYPNYYIILGDGNGVDWHPIWIYPSVWITLMSIGNTTFPASGGILNYNINVGNNESINTTLDMWINVDIPTWIYPYGPVLGPINNFNMPSYPWQKSINRKLNIPTKASFGVYTLNAYLGEYDTTNPIIYAESHLNFVKEGTGRDNKFKLVDSGE